jgi:hypothetical protein
MDDRQEVLGIVHLPILLCWLDVTAWRQGALEDKSTALCQVLLLARAPPLLVDRRMVQEA